MTLNDKRKRAHAKLAAMPGVRSIRRPVTPGDQIRIEVEVLSFRPRAGRIQGRALVDGKLACEATLTCAVVTREREKRAHDASGGEKDVTSPTSVTP